MTLVDTHCHLDLPQFDEDRAAVVERALAAGLAAIIVPAIDLEAAPGIIRLAEEYPAVYAAIGVHPNSTAHWSDDWLADLRALAAHEKVVAIGEIGLDYHWARSPEEMQHRALRLQLELAAELDLPVIIHNREADKDIVRLLKGSPLNGKAGAGVLHSFSGSWHMAMEVMVMGFYVGFTGPVTFQKADELRDIANRVPMERLLVETDAPYLTPQPHRGKRNEPAYVRHVAERLAAERGADAAEFAAQTTVNAAALFNLPLL